jgi:hypothetical protein
MRLFKFLLRFFAALLILFFLAATIYVRIYGKSLVEQALNVTLNRNVVLGKITYHFPFGFRAYDLDISRSAERGEFLKIKKVIAQVSPDPFFQGKLVFDLVFLIEPSLVVQGSKEAAPFPETASAEKSETAASVVGQEQNKQMEISIRRLIVRKGNLRYKDGLTEKGFSFELEEVQLKAENLVFPVKAGKSGFEMSGRLVKEGNPISGSHVTGSGWVDAAQKDMEAKIEVTEANGAIGLTANAVSLNNDMDVSGEIKVRNLLLGADQTASPDASAVNDLVLNALSSSGVEIGAKFAFKTQMDSFRIGQVSFSGSVVSSSDIR